MYSSRVTKNVKVDAFSTPAVALCILIVIASFPVTYFLSIHAPNTYRQTIIQDAGPPKGTALATFAHDYDGLDRMNQDFFLEIQLSNTRAQDIGLERDVLVNIKVFGRRKGEDVKLQHTITDGTHARKFHVVCKVKQPHCESVEVLRLRSIEYRLYHIEVRIDGLTTEQQAPIVYVFNYGNPHYSVLALCVKYLFLVFVLGWLYAFTRHVRRFAAEWDTHTKLLFLLLLALILYNDPLYVLRVSAPTGGLIIPLLSQLFEVTFYAVVAIFILYSMELLLVDLKSINSVYSQTAELHVNIWMKAVVVGLAWIGTMCWITYIRLRQDEDATFNPAQDIPFFWLYAVIGFGLLALLCLWGMFLIVRTLGEISDIREAVSSVDGMESTEFKFYKRRFYLFMSCTIVFIASVLTDLTAAQSSDSYLHSTARIIARIVCTNVYVFVIVFGNLPIPYEELNDDGL